MRRRAARAFRRARPGTACARLPAIRGSSRRRTRGRAALIALVATAGAVALTTAGLPQRDPAPTDRSAHGSGDPGHPALAHPAVPDPPPPTAFAALAARNKPGARPASIRRPTVSTRRVKAQGWPYRNTFPKEVSGSMTTAGITGIAICEGVLRARKRGRGLMRKLVAAREAGFAWLHRNFDVRFNTNASSAGWYYYYL